MKVKICGIKDIDMGLQVAKYRPDYIGYVMSRSKRQISAKQAAAIIDAIRGTNAEHPEMTAVFSTVTREELDDVLSHSDFDVVQFHLPEQLSIVEWIKAKWNKKISLTIPVHSEQGNFVLSNQIDQLMNQLSPYRSYIDTLLLDTHDPLHGGGSGKVFQWEAIPAYMTLAHELSLPMYAAGGLHADNVELLKQQYDINGVDVSSGVESNGEKDIVKIKQFIERVRG